MLSETIALPTHIKDQENRFIVSLKGHLLKHVKEINKLEKSIDGIDLSNFNWEDYASVPSWVNKFKVKNGKLCQVVES